MPVPPPTAPVSIVTGSSRGIGRQIAAALARDGHRLMLVARDATALTSVADELRNAGSQVATVAVDLRATGAVERVLTATEDAFGKPDVIVNNAGTAPSEKVENTTDAMLREAFDLHVAVPLAFARTCAADMKARGSGCLMHLASTAGLQGFAFTSAYSAAKHGMVGLVRALHAELRPRGLHVYAVCPGFVDTDITRRAAAAIARKGRTSADEAMVRMGEQNRIGRMHTPAEVADAVAGLLRGRPEGCVYDLDRSPPAFLDPR
ncbi:MAG TPA: SDR family oxidoreductase [bacterium]|nr:SDR family oxidoreductase [bacterium]